MTVACTALDFTALNILKAAGRKARSEATTQDLSSLQDGESDLRIEKCNTICPVDLFLPLLSQSAVTSNSASKSLKKIFRSVTSISIGSPGAQVVLGWGVVNVMIAEEFFSAKI